MIYDKVKLSLCLLKYHVKRRIINLGVEMKASDYLYAPAALPLRKEPAVPIEEAEWAPEPV
jgi:hypothetical protein